MILKSQWVGLEFSYYWMITLGVLDIPYLKMINIVISTQRTIISLNFIEANYGIKIIYDQINTPHADMCLSNIIKTHSVY